MIFRYSIHRKIWELISHADGSIHKEDAAKILLANSRLTEEEYDALDNSLNFCTACEYASKMYKDEYERSGVDTGTMCYHCPLEFKGIMEKDSLLKEYAERQGIVCRCLGGLYDIWYTAIWGWTEGTDPDSPEVMARCAKYIAELNVKNGIEHI